MAFYVEITAADSSGVLELRPDGPAQYRPTALRWTTARGDGFKTCTFTLARRVDEDHQDIRKYDIVRVIDEASGDVAWEGYVATKPQTMDQTHSMQIECVGWMAAAKDHKISQLYVDRDLNRWRGPSTQRQADLAAVGWVLDNGNAGARPDNDGGKPALMLQQTRVVTAANGHGTKSELWYDGGPGCAIDRVYFDGRTYDKGANGPMNNASWNVTLFASDSDSAWVNAVSHGVVQAGEIGYFSAVGKRYVGVQMWWGVASTVMDGDWHLELRDLAVFGNHGLPLIGGTDPKGVAASDVIRHLVAKFCPLLDPSGVQDTAYAIRQLRVDDVFPYDAFLQVNGFHRWGMEVWEDRVLHFAPPNLAAADWLLSGEDPLRPITTQFPGPAEDEQPNGVRVKFRDFWGAEYVLTPDDEPTLAWPDADNDATRAGRRRWMDFDVPQPMVKADAVEFARIALADANQQRHPAVFVVLSGEVLDGARHPREAWRVRSGETVALESHPVDVPRLITETTYDAASGSLTVSVDNALGTFEGIQDRWVSELQARNLV